MSGDRVIEESIDELVENFGFFESWEDRYRYLIDLGRKLPPMDEGLKTEETRVRGCVSQVWMVATANPDGTLHIRADSDASIVKGLIALVVAAFGDRSPAEILDTDISGIFGQIGFDQHLSPNRRNGFFSMVERIKALAGKHAA